MSDSLACPWCHEPARDAAGPTWICAEPECPVGAFVREEVPAR